ncbi:MAG: type IV pilin protein [Alcanivorax sediminis]|uniref:type IV pilin protein n=1 Tax=Alcanivorax sediminis TaxID=2663008 RepID=UPI003C3A2D82
MLRKSNETGFTLIELMITVMIVAILAAIAYPSYTNHVRNTVEAKVRGDLMDLASSQERWRSQNFQYTNSLTKLGSSLASDEKYTTSITLANNGQTYEALAKPKAGSIVAGEVSFKINQDGDTCFGKDGCTIGTSDPWSKR